MNLFDVKNAIETIVRLNPGITEERLIVLLQAANWDHAHIDEGVMLFRDMTPEISAHNIDEHHLLEAHYEEEKAVKQEQQIPAELPLKPFESSPQVLTFSTYKDIFHGEKIPEQETRQKPLEVHKDELVHIPDTGVIPRRYVFDPTEPLTGTDISLAFIVTLLILTILLLMGYMYTNDRLFI
ncbi:MAG: hypothetical protein QG653_652 [Patescibacteria group bacterium]|nr:hypothetical protein [Patescibacteria group bacterium]